MGAGGSLATATAPEEDGKDGTDNMKKDNDQDDDNEKPMRDERTRRKEKRNRGSLKKRTKKKKSRQTRKGGSYDMTVMSAWSFDELL